MKKTYIIPTTQIVRVSVPRIIAASTIEVSDNTASVETTDDEYNGMFNAKESAGWEDDLW